MLYWGGKSLLNPQPTVLLFALIPPPTPATTVIKVITRRASLSPPLSSIFPAEIGHLSAGRLPLTGGEECWLVN